MPLEAWIVCGTVLLLVAVLAGNWAPPDTAFVGALTLLLALGVFDGAEGEAFEGFANPGTIMVAALYVVAAALQETGALESTSRFLFGAVSSVRAAQVRLLVPTTLASAFLNNTPVVAILLPVVRDWARRAHISASKLLLPLSYAAIFGGMCTLIGTSTNLVVYGLAIGSVPEVEIGFFDVAWVGVPGAVVGLAWILVASGRLLSSDVAATSRVEDPRRYGVEMSVMDDSSIGGLTIEEAGLRSLPGLFLASINRQGTILAAVSPHERILPGDRLTFVGVVDSIADLQKIRGLVPTPEQVLKLDSPRSDRCLVEAVVSNTSPLIGRTIRDAGFRTQYDAAIIAVHRSGRRLQGKIGDIALEPGDNLLLETHPEFVDRQRNSQSFFLVSAVEGSAPPRHDRAPYALGILALMVQALFFGWVPPVVAALLAAGAMLGFRCLSAGAARRSLDLSTLIVIGAAFGIANALERSGAAPTLAAAVAEAVAGGSPWMALAAVFAITSVLTAFISNVAAAALVFPLALDVARALDASFHPFAIVLMIAASAGFATPVGYQTNLMVWSAGGYRFRDFVVMGVPLTIAYGILAVLLAPAVFPF